MERTGIRRSLHLTLTTSILFLLAVATSEAQSSLQPRDWDAQTRLTEAADANRDPRIVEVSLESRVARVEIGPGLNVEAWTYNGGIPGPLIRVRAGDRLIVHFRNSLPQPTTVHWHGMRVPIQMDGVPGISQPEVRQGESFTYDFIVPDAGLYWYHPHVMSAAQVGYGLYGALLVEDPTEQVGVPDELVLVLSDIDVEDNGKLRDPEDTGKYRFVFGLEGNHFLVNGKKRPKLTARVGAPQRWRVVNASKAKYFELQLPGPRGEKPFVVIGGDGGLNEYAVRHETLLIAPGERVDTIVTPAGKAGSQLEVLALPYNRGYGSEYLHVENLFTIALTGTPPQKSASSFIPSPTKRQRVIEPLDQAGAASVRMDFTIFQVDEKTLEYRINNEPMTRMTPVQARVGETQIWTISNQTQWSHPIHLHGFFFQVINDDGKPAQPLGWKDTLNVPFNETVRFVVKYDDRPGVWMFHCHVLDHAEGGLMTTVELGVTQSGSHHRHAAAQP
jgi:FtsP/CotA-like multicopper oxidase with cupredoxin domain